MHSDARSLPKFLIRIVDGDGAVKKEKMFLTGYGNLSEMW